MRKVGLFAGSLVCLAAGALAAPAATQLDQWGGRYTEVLQLGLSDDDRYGGLNQVDIRPIDATTAEVDMALEFYAGHSCDLNGIASLRGNRLVLELPELKSAAGKACHLELWRDRTRLRWRDPGNTCKGGCGARGSFERGSVPLASKRPIPPKPPAVSED